MRKLILSIIASLFLITTNAMSFSLSDANLSIGVSGNQAAYYAEGKENHFLNKVSTCVLESANVTYGGDRVQFFRPHSDGSGAPPVETSISLEFKEIELITRESAEEGF